MKDLLTQITIPDSIRHILSELDKRYIRIQVIPDTNILLLEKGKQKKIIVGGYLPFLPYDLGLLLSNKFFAKQVLKRRRISTPEGKSFLSSQKREALAYAHSLGYPVVLKVENSETNLQSQVVRNDDTFLSSFQTLASTGFGIVAESHVSGSTFSVLIFSSGFISILEKKSHDRISLLPEREIDKNMTGTIWFDVTEKRRAELLPLAKKVLASFGSPSFLRFTVKLQEDVLKSYSVLEIYHGVSMHVQSFAWKGRQKLIVSELICDLLFE
jgi:hypothetical protein